MTGVGSSPALATCETSQHLLAGVSGGIPSVLPFHPTFRLAGLDMSDIIFKLNKKKEEKKKLTLVSGTFCHGEFFPTSTVQEEHVVRY